MFQTSIEAIAFPLHLRYKFWHRLHGEIFFMFPISVSLVVRCTVVSKTLSLQHTSQIIQVFWSLIQVKLAGHILIIYPKYSYILAFAKKAKKKELYL